MNRPFGSGEDSPVRIETFLTLVYIADVSANIKGVVSKAMTQKILSAAAERGEITQKTYGTPSHVAWASTLTLVTGKATYFVAKQASSTLARNNAS
jgi:hypothetical protein